MGDHLMIPPQNNVACTREVQLSTYIFVVCQCPWACTVGACLCHQHTDYGSFLLFSGTILLTMHSHGHAT